jgi:hypothetical protein
LIGAKSTTGERFGFPLGFARGFGKSGQAPGSAGEKRLVLRACFKNAFQVGRRIPQGLKPAFLLAHGGTAEAVPYPRLIFETRSINIKYFQSLT